MLCNAPALSLLPAMDKSTALLFPKTPSSRADQGWLLKHYQTQLAQISCPTHGTKALPKSCSVLCAAPSPGSPQQAALEPRGSPKPIHFFLHHGKVSLQPRKTNLVPWETPGLQKLFLFQTSMENTNVLYLFTTQNIRNLLLIFLKCYI